jgi:hypothetical protein
VGGTIITNTQFDITYVSDGITPASDIVIGVSAPVDMQSREFHITGADLGFGSGSGTFTGTFETDELNGEVGQDFPDFPTVIHLTIDSVAGGVRGLGFFQDSFINLAVIPVPDPNGIRFDFNADGNVDVTDIDLLVAEIVAGTNEESFDLSGEGVVDETDLRQWLSDAAIHNGFSEAYLPGDTNLDGSVDATDLNNLGLKWQQDVANWSGGDITVDGRVNSADLNAIGINWQQSISMASSVNAPVPEPSAFLLTIVGLALVWRRPRYS